MHRVILVPMCIVHFLVYVCRVHPWSLSALHYRCLSRTFVGSRAIAGYSRKRAANARRLRAGLARRVLGLCPDAPGAPLESTNHHTQARGAGTWNLCGRPHAYGYGLCIRSHLPTELGYLVYAGDLYCQKGVGRVLYHLRRLKPGFHEGCLVQVQHPVQAAHELQGTFRIFFPSVSTHTTVLPKSARQAPDTNSTYPVPMTAIFTM